MEAKLLSGVYPSFKNVIKADKYVRRIVENAEYMELCEEYTMCFYPVRDDEIIALNSFVYEINGKYYYSIMTNVHSELIYFYNKEIIEKGYEQISLF